MGQEIITTSDAAQPLAPLDPESAGTPLNTRRLIQVLRERWWLLLLLALLGGGAAGYHQLKAPAKYQARAVLQVEQGEQKLIRMDDVSPQDLRAGEWLNTLVQNIKNNNVMLGVVRHYDLTNDTAFLPGRTNRLTETQAARILGSMVIAKLRPETRLIDVTVSHADPSMAQKLANAVAREYIQELQEQRFETTKAANELLYQEAINQKNKLDAAERRLQEYKEANQTLSQQDRDSITGEKLKDINGSYTLAKAERLRLEADLKQILALTNNPEALLAIPRVIDDPAISDLRRRMAEQQANVATLSQRYKPKYPKMIQAQRQLDDIRETMKSIALTLPRSVEVSYEAAVAREKNLETALKEAQQEALNLDKKSIDYNVLEREVQSDRALYESVLKRLKEIDLSKRFDSSSIILVEAADRPNTPIKLSTKLVAAGTFMAILLGGLSIFYLIRAMNSSIQTVDDAENMLGLPVWAAIPVATRKHKRVPHVIVDEPASVCSEGFRTLRTNAALTVRRTGGRIQAFTSADPAEGKTFCSLNHALCHAQQGKATLLIDLDLRRPSLGESLGLPTDAPGVTDFLTGKKPLHDCIQPTRYPNLFIMPAGPLIQNPSEELAKDTVSKMLKQLQSEYDHIVLDTAPVLAVSDAFMVLPLAETICLVVRTGKTPRRVVNRALELMARANVPPAGVVLNFLPRSSGRNYYYYGYDRKYNKDGVYHANPKHLEKEKAN